MAALLAGFPHAGFAQNGAPSVQKGDTASETKGGELLASARSSWEQGSLEEAAVLYQSALDAGKLTADEWIEAHTHLGTVTFATGKLDQAKHHFAVAAMVDPNFLLPAEASRRANDFATAQRKAAEAGGKLDLILRPPGSATAGQPVRVDIRLKRDALTIVKKVELTIEAGKRRLGKQVLGAKPELELQVTAAAFPKNSQLQIIVRALDEHESTLVSRVANIAIEGGGPVLADPVTGLPKDPSTTKKGKGKSFWATPWPYIIGGTLLVSGGITLIVMTRFPDVDTQPIKIIGAPVSAGMAPRWAGGN